MRDESRLVLADLELPAQDVHDLYSVMGDIFGMAVHDLRAPINAMVFNIVMISESIDKIQEQIRSSGKQDLDRLGERLTRQNRVLSDETQRLSKQIDLLFGRGNYSSSGPFVSGLVDIVKVVAKVHDDVRIAVATSNPKSLEILFPRNVLAGVLSELIANAKRAMQRDPKLLVCWDIKGFTFKLEVHDSGPGVIIGKNGEVSTADASIEIASSTGAKRAPERNGLRLIDNLLRRVGGQISFGRSRTLGGAVVKVQFPVKAYYKRGVGRDFVGRR